MSLLITAPGATAPLILPGVEDLAVVLVALHVRAQGAQAERDLHPVSAAVPRASPSPSSRMWELSNVFAICAAAVEKPGYSAESQAAHGTM